MRYVFNGVEIIQTPKRPLPDLKVKPEDEKLALAVDDPRTLEAQALWNEAFQMGRKNAIEECASHDCMWCIARSKR